MSEIESVDHYSEVDSVGYESTPSDDETSKLQITDLATTKHFNELNQALTEVEKVAAEKTGKGRSLPAKNAMITTFKIMQIVMETLRETTEAGKEANKAVKKEWKAVSDLQSANNEASREAVYGNQNYQWVPLALGQLHTIASMAVHYNLNEPIGKGLEFLPFEGIKNLGESIQNATRAKEYIKDAVTPFSTHAGKMGQDMLGAWTGAEQYNLGVKESLYQHEVQTHSSEYQNGSQQQTSDKQSVDNAADTAKQLIRVQGEILMGKSG